MIPTWLQFLLGACALCVTLAQLAGRFGWWMGASGTSTDALAQEVQRLRDWRHKVGEDPCDPLSKLMTLHVQNFEHRVARLERKIFNGQAHE